MKVPATETTLLTAEEALRIAREYPERKVKANVSGILELIRSVAANGHTSTEVEIHGSFQEETINELKKLGYVFSKPIRYKVSSTFYTVYWDGRDS